MLLFQAKIKTLKPYKSNERTKYGCNFALCSSHCQIAGAPSYPVAPAMETHAVSVLLNNFWAELRNAKKFFSINIFVENLFFKAVLPVNDILSDFIVADNLYNTDYNITIVDQIKPTQYDAMLMYFFIASPGFMVLIFNIGSYLDKFCFAWQSFLVLVVIVVILPVLLPLYGDPRVVFYIALVVSCCFELVGYSVSCFIS